MAVQGPSNRGIWNGPTGRSHDSDAGRSRRSDGTETTRRTGFDTEDRFSSRRSLDRSGSRDGSRTSLFGGLKEALSSFFEKGVSFFKSLFSSASYTPKPILPPGGVRIQPPTDTATQPTDSQLP